MKPMRGTSSQEQVFRTDWTVVVGRQESRQSLPEIILATRWSVLEQKRVVRSLVVQTLVSRILE